MSFICQFVPIFSNPPRITKIVIGKNWQTKIKKNEILRVIKLLIISFLPTLANFFQILSQEFPKSASEKLSKIVKNEYPKVEKNKGSELIFHAN